MRGLWILAVVIVSCATKPEPTAGKAKPSEERASPAPAKHDWQRMKECAEQADRLARKFGWVEGKVDQLMGSITGIDNHYSARFERCYVEVWYWTNPPKGPGIPLTYRVAFDAFEQRVVATCTEQGDKTIYCSVSDRGVSAPGDCAACARFLAERLDDATPDGPTARVAAK
jgi:hypothetical protein